MVFFLLLIYIAIIFILQKIKLAKIMSIIVFFIKLLLSQKMTDINQNQKVAVQIFLSVKIIDESYMIVYASLTLKHLRRN